MKNLALFSIVLFVSTSALKANAETKVECVNSRGGKLKIDVVGPNRLTKVSVSQPGTVPAGALSNLQFRYLDGSKQSNFIVPDGDVTQEYRFPLIAIDWTFRTASLQIKGTDGRPTVVDKYANCVKN